MSVEVDGSEHVLGSELALAVCVESIAQAAGRGIGAA